MADNTQIVVSWFSVMITTSWLVTAAAACEAPITLEINFEILFRNLKHVLFCEILRKKFHCDWSIGQCLQISI